MHVTHAMSSISRSYLNHWYWWDACKYKSRWAFTYGEISPHTHNKECGLLYTLIWFLKFLRHVRLNSKQENLLLECVWCLMKFHQSTDRCHISFRFHQGGGWQKLCIYDLIVVRMILRHCREFAWVMEFIFGALVIKNEREWIFILCFLMKLSWCLAECNSFHFEFEIAPNAVLSLQAFMVCYWNSCRSRRSSWTHTLQIFTPKHVWPIVCGDVQENGTHIFPKRPLEVKFVLLPSLRLHLSDISVLYITLIRSERAQVVGPLLPMRI